MKISFLSFFFVDAAGTTSASDDEENEFFDAQEGASIASQEDSSFVLKIPLSSHRRNSNTDATGSSSEGEEGSSGTQQVMHFHCFRNDKLILLIFFFSNKGISCCRKSRHTASNGSNRSCFSK